MNRRSERTKVLETRFLEHVDEVDVPSERLKLWPEMASAYMQANNPSEAAVCWLSAIWEERRILASLDVGAGSKPKLPKPVGTRLPPRFRDWLSAPSQLRPSEARAIGARISLWAAGQQDGSSGGISGQPKWNCNRYLNEQENRVAGARGVAGAHGPGSPNARRRARPRSHARPCFPTTGCKWVEPGHRRACVSFVSRNRATRTGSDASGRGCPGKRERIRSWIESLNPTSTEGGEPHARSPRPIRTGS